MPPRQNEKRDIRPASPDPTVRGLLALPLVQIRPLEAGNRLAGYGETGEYILAASVQGGLTVAAYGQYILLDPGQAFLLESPGEYTLQAVSDGLCMVLRLQGELVPRLLEGRLSGKGTLFAWPFWRTSGSRSPEPPPLPGPSPCCSACGTSPRASGPAWAPPWWRGRWPSSRRTSPIWRGWTSWPTGWTCPPPI